MAVKFGLRQAESSVWSRHKVSEGLWIVPWNLLLEVARVKVAGEVTTYTSAQAEAIACLDEPLQIIACAGSGKTQVISQRISSILAQPGAEPKSINAFTSTE